MSLSIVSRSMEGVTVLDLSGRISLGEGAEQVHDAICDLVGKGEKNILLNMAGVSYIDSAGLGELVRAYTTARSQRASVKLLNPSDRVKYVLQLTKLHKFFEIYDDEASALASCK